MAKLSIKVASTSQTINIFIADSSSTTGAGLAGLVYNTSGLIAYYMLPKAAAVSITLATLSAVTSAYSSGGFKEIDATHCPGWYRFDIPDAAIASGRFADIHFQGAANMAPLPIEIELTGWDNQDAVHGGLSALPNTAVTTNASLLTSGTGTDQLSVTSGRIDAGKWLGGTIPAVNVTGVPLVDLKYTLGTISPAAAGSVSPDWGQVVNKTTTNALTNTTISTAQVAASVTADVGITQAAADKVFGSSGATLAECAQATPGTTPTPGFALMLLYMTLRNKLTVDGSTKSIFNNAGTCIVKKAVADDGTTYTETQAVSGP